jgi:hypothetical protein
MAFQYLNRLPHAPLNPTEIALRLSEVHDEWLMTDAERATLHFGEETSK